MPRYIPTIGLEVHVQLKTRSKMFCGCPVEYGAAPNAHTCPVCLGYPGALPVMNEEALKMSALTGLMLGCKVPDICKFDRKNYFYPDMPKNYQITQFDQPICAGGAVPLHDFAYPKDAQKSIAHAGKAVKLTRIHLEEDVAKSQHFETSTGIDFNRAGTPLMEIVSEPEIDTPEEAFAYLTSLQQILVYGGVSDADMEKGQLRCDCNVSVRPEGTSELGVKIEIKNMNSISGVRRALAYEIARQIDAVQRGETLIQSTRRWDDDAGQTFQMRIKESSHDYRYFPDPDLLPVDTRAFMEEVRTRRPELPGEKRDRFERDFGVTAYDASVLASERALADYFDAAAKSARKPKNVANWIINDLLSALAAAEKTIGDCPISAQALDALVNLIDEGKINSTQGKEVFAEMFATGKAAGAIVKEKGLEQMSDTGAIEALCDQAIAASAKAVAEYKAGKAQAINSIKGQVMKLSQGKANPQLVGEILVRKLPNKLPMKHPFPAVFLVSLVLAMPGIAADKKSGKKSSTLPPTSPMLVVPKPDATPSEDGASGKLITSEMSGRDLAFFMQAVEAGREQAFLVDLLKKSASSDEIKKLAENLGTAQAEENMYIAKLAAQKGLSVSLDPTAAQKKAAVEFAKLSGSNFDKAVMDKVAAANAEARTAYQDAAQSADPQTKTFAAQMLPLAEQKQHIVEKMTGAGSKTANQLFRHGGVSQGTPAAATPSGKSAPGASPKATPAPK